MTLLDEEKWLRREILKLRGDKRRRYPDELRRRILNWIDRATEGGAQESQCGKALGVKTWLFTTWRRRDAREAAREAQEAQNDGEIRDEASPLALVPVEVPTFSMMSGLTVVTPAGYRIEGLSLEQVVALLRELA